MREEENEKAYTIQRRIAMTRQRSQRLWITDDCNSNRFRTDLYAIDKEHTCERGFGEEAAAAAEATERRSLRGEMLGTPGGSPLQSHAQSATGRQPQSPNRL
jgi:hypothetical protein